MNEADYQAEECIRVAQKAWAAGNIAKANKFLHKSMSIKPSERAKDLIRLYAIQAQHRATPTPKPQQRAPTPSRSPSESQANYSAEQQTAAINLKNTEDYYQRLGVARDANDQQLHRAYKKLALKFHPDKNRAPAAEEAMKAVNRAYECLKDPQKRRIYNQTGSEDAQPQSNYRSRRGYHSGGYQEFEPEDIFDAFFGGRRFNRGHRHAANDGEQRGGNPLQTLFLPLIMILLFSLFSGVPSQTSNAYPFRLEKQDSYTIQRTTDLDVVYYVNRNFAYSYGSPRRLSQVETVVNQQYYEKLTEGCNSEREMQAKLVAEAKQYRGAEQAAKLHEAFAFDLHSCQQLADAF